MAVFYVNHVIVFQQFLVKIQSRQKYWIGIFFYLDKALFKDMILLQKYIRMKFKVKPLKKKLFWLICC